MAINSLVRQREELTSLWELLKHSSGVILSYGALPLSKMHGLGNDFMVVTALLKIFSFLQI